MVYENLDAFALTAQRFISHPNLPGTRLYRTGDVVRYLPDGNIEFLGRSDYQVKIRGFRIELAEVEAAIVQHPQVKETAVVVREDTPGNQRLVAYVVAQQHAPDLITALHQLLKNRLPNYMIPSAFVLLEALPVLPNGKLNRQALPVPDLTRSEIEESFVPPKTNAEKILAKIWAEVLRLDKVGIHDNFFELGGDSILSIQVIARAKQAGLQLTAKQLFEHQAIAQLAAVAGTITLPEAEQGLVTGEVPLTPIQNWFFEQNFPHPHHWNQSALLEPQQQLDPQLLATAIQHLLEHHDALRLRYEQRECGWRQFITSTDNSQVFTHIDLSAFAALPAQAIETAATEIQASLNLSQGPLVRVALFELGRQNQRLLVVIHHLAVDGVSWRILLEDLQTAYHQLSQGQPVKLPAKTTSFKQWATLLQDYAQSKTLQQELEHWLSLSSATVSPLPVDYPGGTNTVADSHTISVHLTAAETTALLTEVPATYNTQIIDVLLTALVQALTPWMGSSTLLVNLEGHGREEIFNHVDLSRTVGWFTSEFPVFLSLEKVSQQPGDTLKTIKEQLRRIPNRGIGYGILRYLHNEPDIVKQLQAIPPTQVSFNYLGQFDQVLSDASLLVPASEASGSAYHHQSQRSQLLEINGLIVGNKLCLDWTYSQSLFNHTTIEKLAANFLQALQEIITHCQNPDVGGYTPSDFPEVELSQTELDKVLAEMDFG